MKNKIFTRIIITTLLCAFLTLNVGKVTRVSAVGTTIAASAAAALCAVGIVYCSYMALTGVTMQVPDTSDDIIDWLQNMGTKVVQYPSGRAAYEELYPELIGIGDEPLTSMLDRAWTWSVDKLKSWANDFSSTSVISQIASYEVDVDVSNIPTNGYEYPSFSWTTMAPNGTFTNLSGLQDLGYTISYFTGPKVCYKYGDTYFMVSSNISTPARNKLTTNNTYVGEYWNGSEWIGVRNYSLGFYAEGNGYRFRYGIGNVSGTNCYYITNTDIVSTAVREYTYPLFPQEVIYDEANDRNLPMVIPSALETRSPQWLQLPPEDDNKPVIPYVKLPYDPSWIDPVTNIPGGGNWGFNLAQLLDALEDLAGLLMEIGAIGELINQFKDLISGNSGDEYYIYYDDSTNNYYQYYTITNFGDNIYNYDIDVSEVDEHLPVDLNTIQSYSSNRYLEQIKQSAINGSSIVRDFAVFWYDVDPEVTYIALGICIIILIGAFTGKLGHS